MRVCKQSSEEVVSEGFFDTRRSLGHSRDPMSSACTRSSGITVSMMNVDAVKTEPAQRRSKSQDKSARDLSNRDLFYTWLGQSFQPSPYFVYP